MKMVMKDTIIFCSQTKKNFTIEEFFSKQNDRVSAQLSVEAWGRVLCVQQGHHPSYIMV